VVAVSLGCGRRRLELILLQHVLRRLLPLALLAAPCHAFSASGVVCHVDYGGEQQVIRAAPMRNTYAVTPIAVGSYFLFRVVFEHPARALPGIKITTFADREDGPVPLHVAHFPYPVANGGRFGFTGEQFVYEPVRDGELRYWCALVRS
jgi:hypothetical protein